MRPGHRVAHLITRRRLGRDGLVVRPPDVAHAQAEARKGEGGLASDRLERHGGCVREGSSHVLEGV